MAHILAVGIATLDIVNLVEGYPPEDAEVRAVAQEVRRGGNATNTLAVLSRLGHRTAWAGVLAEEPDAGRIAADLARFAIDTRHCRREPRGKVPTSYITLNRRNGSRTIVHYRDLPEYPFADFARIDLAPYDWLHFEGRDVVATARMMALARQRRPELPLSLEVEKARPGIEALLPLADLLLFSRGYAASRGCDDGAAFLAEVAAEAPAAELVCGWGASGAYGRGRDGTPCFSPAFPPPQVVETLAAGDTLNAGVIDARLRGLPLAAAVAAGCRLAGRKCGLAGLAGLGPEPAGESTGGPAQ